MVTWLKRCWTLALAYTRGIITGRELKAEVVEATRRARQGGPSARDMGRMAPPVLEN